MTQLMLYVGAVVLFRCRRARAVPLGKYLPTTAVQAYPTPAARLQSALLLGCAVLCARHAWPSAVRVARVRYSWKVPESAGLPFKIGMVAGCDGSLARRSLVMSRAAIFVTCGALACEGWFKACGAGTLGLSREVDQILVETLLSKARHNRLKEVPRPAAPWDHPACPAE